MYATKGMHRATTLDLTGTKKSTQSMENEDNRKELWKE